MNNVTEVHHYDWPAGTRENWFPIEPFDDKVYVEQITEEKSALGIILPGDSGKMQMGRVIAAGPGKMFHAPFNVSESHAAVVFVPTRLKVGDFVAWGRWTSGGEPFVVDGKTIVGCSEGDLGGRVFPNADGTLPKIMRKQD